MSHPRLRIAMLSVHSCPLGQLGGRDSGGMNVYIRELARALGERGHSVDVYTRAHNPRDGQIYQLGPNARLIHIKAGRVEDMGKLVQYRHLADFAGNLEDFRRSHQLQYDLIHSHYWLSGQVGRWLGELWQVPDIAMFHTLGAVKNRLGLGLDETETRLKTERQLARDCHRIIAATEGEKQDLIYYYRAPAETISVIPCGVNLGLFGNINKQGAREELGLDGDRVVLFVGRIEPLKGIDRLLKAMAILGRRPGLKLLVIGGDEHSRGELKKLRLLARELAIEDSVSFLGSVPQPRLPLFYSAADVCVVPSYYETFGLVALESLACGTPVVATRVGAAGDIIRQGETGYLVADNTPHKLAQMIDRLLGRRVPGTMSARAIRDSVRRFDWTSIAKAIIKEYRAVVGDHASVS